MSQRLRNSRSLGALILRNVEVASSKNSLDLNVGSSATSRKENMWIPEFSACRGCFVSQLGLR